MDADEVLRVLGLLADIDVWVDGGWGVDALLGEQSRAHGDLDLVIPIGRLDDVLAVLGRDGFTVLRDLRPTAVAVRDTQGLEVDLHPVTPRPDGAATQDLGGDPGLAGLPPFRYDPPAWGRIGGVPVRCVDPATQLRAHQGYPLRDRDRADVARLVAAFALPVGSAEQPPTRQA